MMDSRSWRVLEPGRQVMRLLTGKRAPAPFVPRLIGVTDASPGGRAAREAQRRARILMDLGARRDYVALAARTEEFSCGAGKNAAFLGVFGRMIALRRHSAFDEGAALWDRFEAELGPHRDWLVRFFGPQIWVRFVIDASSALTRVGRYPEARALVDDALERTGAPDMLMTHRAEMSFPYALDSARADLAAVAARRPLSGGKALLAVHLDFLAAGEAVDPAAFDARAHEHPEALLVAANAWLVRGDRAAYRARINRWFADHGLIPPLGPGAETLALQNPGPGPAASVRGPLVSVVMTSWNSAETIDQAIRSIRVQTWADLEILVVDDCSTDDTRERLAAIAAEDPRVRPIHATENTGTYCAKNQALAVARGEYVTFHDSDDWAHPERIERQVGMMEAAPHILASRAFWLRVEPGGHVQFRRWGAHFQHANPASVFMRRETLEQAGYFDSVRYGADSEYWFRLGYIFGRKRVRQFPLCVGFGSTREVSLTRSGAGAMGVENYAPSRGAYAAGYLDWHTRSTPATLRLPPRLASRPFPASPEMIVPPPPEREPEDRSIAEAAAPFPAAKDAQADASPPLPPAATAPAAAAAPEPAQDASRQGSPRRHAPAAEGLPELMFGISLASARVIDDWPQTTALLGHTLRSLLAQSDPRFSVAICGHERPAIPELDDPRVLFMECDRNPPKKSGNLRGDKMRKRRLVARELGERGGGYFFPLDADDLVHRDFVAHVRASDNRAGYLIDRGYALDYGNRRLAPIPAVWSVSFDRVCGSSAAIWFEPDELPRSGDLDEELYFNLFQSHAYWPIVAQEYDRPLATLPFPAGVYVVNHAQNLSFRLQRKGLRTENIIRAIGTHQLGNGDDILHRDFGWHNPAPTRDAISC